MVIRDNDGFAKNVTDLFTGKLLRIKFIKKRFGLSAGLSKDTL